MSLEALIDSHAYAVSNYGEDHPTTQAILALIREAVS